MERPGLFYDTAMLISPEGAIAGKYRKVHPAPLLSLEKMYFRGGSSFPVFPLPFVGLEDWTIGFSICYDNLFPESCRCLVVAGAELIIARTPRQSMIRGKSSSRRELSKTACSWPLAITLGRKGTGACRARVWSLLRAERLRCRPVDRRKRFSYSTFPAMTLLPYAEVSRSSGTADRKPVQQLQPRGITAR
jgi:hypothetical protein